MILFDGKIFRQLGGKRFHFDEGESFVVVALCTLAGQTRILIFTSNFILLVNIDAAAYQYSCFTSILLHFKFSQDLDSLQQDVLKTF